MPKKQGSKPWEVMQDVFSALDLIKIESVQNHNGRGVEQYKFSEETFIDLSKAVIKYDTSNIENLMWLSVIVATGSSEQDKEKNLLEFYMMDCRASPAKFKKYFESAVPINVDKSVALKDSGVTISINGTERTIHYRYMPLLVALHDLLFSLFYENFLESLLVMLRGPISENEIEKCTSLVSSQFRKAISRNFGNEHLVAGFNKYRTFLEKENTSISKTIAQTDNEDILRYWFSASLRDEYPVVKFETVMSHIVDYLDHNSTSLDIIGLKNAKNHDGCLENGTIFETLEGPQTCLADVLIELESENGINEYDLSRDNLTSDASDYSPLTVLKEASDAGVKYLPATELSWLKPFYTYRQHIHSLGTSILRVVAFKPVQDIIQSNMDSLSSTSDAKNVFDQAFLQSVDYVTQCKMLIALKEKIVDAKSAFINIIKTEEVTSNSLYGDLKSFIDERQSDYIEYSTSKKIARSGFKKTDIPSDNSALDRFLQSHLKSMQSTTVLINIIEQYIHWFSTTSIDFIRMYEIDKMRFREQFEKMYLNVTDEGS